MSAPASSAPKAPSSPQAVAKPPAPATPAAPPAQAAANAQAQKLAQQEKEAAQEIAKFAGRTARAAQVRRRHVVLATSFCVMVVLPAICVAYYLWFIAQDQYASRVGFAVRTNEVESAVELLGGITEIGGSSSSDTDILFEFIQSETIVRLVDEKLDLTAIYSNPDDLFFGLGKDTRIEALADYWNSMVKVFYDPGTGLIVVRVLAFAPEDAQAIAQMIFDESNRTINELSAIARDDSTRYAFEELQKAETRLTLARAAVQRFRSANNLYTPEADIQGRLTILNAMGTNLASTKIELAEVLARNANDPRAESLRLRIDVIEKQIEQERGRFGSDVSVAGGGRDYADLLAEFEALQVAREFAENSYQGALAGYDAALAEAQRRSRYLAAFIEPTLAETSQFPRRSVWLAVVAGFLFAGWAILAMVFYSLRDRR